MTPSGIERATFRLVGRRLNHCANANALVLRRNYIENAKDTFCTKYIINRGPGSSVGIATELRAGRSGIESRWGRDFPPIQTGLGAHPASCKMGTGLSREYRWPGRGADPQPYLVPKVYSP